MSQAGVQAGSDIVDFPGSRIDLHKRDEWTRKNKVDPRLGYPNVDALVKISEFIFEWVGGPH